MARSSASSRARRADQHSRSVGDDEQDRHEGQRPSEHLRIRVKKPKPFLDAVRRFLRTADRRYTTSADFSDDGL